jgi:3-dehydroquinate synthase
MLPQQTHSTTLTVESATGAYRVHIGTELLGHVADTVAHESAKSRAFILTSPNIAALWLAPLLAGFTSRGLVEPVVLTLAAGEEHKRFATLERLCEELAQHGADRDSVLIALGGGVAGDLTGFLAAIYMRGIRWIGVPTTVLAQVDSSIGGKTGANLAAGKNLVGAFHSPLAVFSDTATLRTLPPRELRAGLQEAVKSGVIRDAELFQLLEEHSAAVLAQDPETITRVIAASVQVKARVVAADERETGERMLLNLGHTLGHALEAATQYTQLLHGEAVAWGMLAATRIAAARTLLTAAEAARIEHTVRLYGPLQPFTADAEALVALTAKDKKHRSGTRSFILPTSIGDAVVVRDVTEVELLKAAQSIVQEAQPIVPQAESQR